VSGKEDILSEAPPRACRAPLDEARQKFTRRDIILYRAFSSAG
jgi:hypothetical protein